MVDYKINNSDWKMLVNECNLLVLLFFQVDVKWKINTVFVELQLHH